MADIIRRDPFQDIARLWPRAFGRDWMSHLGGRFPEIGDWVPSCDVTEQDDAVIVDAELPGVEAKDVEVSLDGEMLTVRGEKRSEKTEEKNGRTYAERSFGSFERSVSTPGGADPASIVALSKDGALHVRVPRKQPVNVEPKRIEVNTA